MTSEAALPTAPPRGTRPRNRRDLILAAAARLFAAHGYAHVSMSDVASAVNVAPSAIYRHFPGKSALLFDVVSAGIASFDTAVLEAPTVGMDDFLEHLATAALDQRHLGVLWQRESRNLSDADRAKLRMHLRSTLQCLAVMIRAHRAGVKSQQADLVAAGIVAMLTSISFHRIDLPRTKYAALLEDMARRIITFVPATAGPHGKAPREPLFDRTRREQLMDATVSLVAARGFPAVSIDDIGAAVGIAGPSLYHHFESKQQLLTEAFKRGSVTLNRRVELALANVDSGRPPLRRLSDAYVDTSFDHSDAISILISESGHLDPIEERRTRQTQRTFVDRWVALARTDKRGETVAATRIRVQAAQMMANDLGRTRHLHGIPGFRSLVQELCWVVQQPT